MLLSHEDGDDGGPYCLNNCFLHNTLGDYTWSHSLAIGSAFWLLRSPISLTAHRHEDQVQDHEITSHEVTRSRSLLLWDSGRTTLALSVVGTPGFAHADVQQAPASPSIRQVVGL
ncbi:hypothetical protein B5807_01462 [Epicoccum nigrum]|jgi:hypothetical protein|uniref:Uncharacterized protein n=1 Tax=Epicoccum nigrum TaxID=105696 RepID=A0A1Y2MGU6_EPING|nr:hypothetical protein B5807_01462 [Epicoccum nigrum]